MLFYACGCRGWWGLVRPRVYYISERREGIPEMKMKPRADARGRPTDGRSLGGKTTLGSEICSLERDGVKKRTIRWRRVSHFARRLRGESQMTRVGSSVSDILRLHLGDEVAWLLLVIHYEFMTWICHPYLPTTSLVSHA